MKHDNRCYYAKGTCTFNTPVCRFYEGSDRTSADECKHRVGRHCHSSMAIIDSLLRVHIEDAMPLTPETLLACGGHEPVLNDPTDQPE